MEITEQQCNECGASDWRHVLDTEYPERRRDRDRTIRYVYVCDECGAEGRHFEYHNGDGSDTLAGALR